MSVKKKDRHLSRSECLNLARNLVMQVMTITRPAIKNDDGKVIKPGILGTGQAFAAFGADLLRSSKAVHANCYQAVQIYIKDAETLKQRNEFFKKAIEQCDSMLRQLDLCIFQYARKNKKKRKSFGYVAKLVHDMKQGIYIRMNLDNLILQHIQEKKKRMRT